MGGGREWGLRYDTGRGGRGVLLGKGVSGGWGGIESFDGVGGWRGVGRVG